MISRGELWEILQSNGASVRDSMSKNVSCLLVGTGYGETKIAHARKHGIPTISLPMAECLGLLYTHNRVLPSMPTDVVAQLILQTAFLCEVLYAKSLDSGRIPTKRSPEQRRALGRFYMLAAGLERLLQSTFIVDDDEHARISFETAGELLPTVDQTRSNATTSNGAGV
jgi:hypothetical protein